MHYGVAMEVTENYAHMQENIVWIEVEPMDVDVTTFNSPVPSWQLRAICSSMDEFFKENI